MAKSYAKTIPPTHFKPERPQYLSARPEAGATRGMTMRPAIVVIMIERNITSAPS
jgi:hypothetical protein